MCLNVVKKARTDNSNKHVGVLNLKSKSKFDEFLSKHWKNIARQSSIF